MDDKIIAALGAVAMLAYLVPATFRLSEEAGRLLRTTGMVALATAMATAVWLYAIN